jgi:catechol 2,3-dioxygenase-like lactoylglutathione lyase family enzyme
VKVELAKDAADFGILINDAAASLAFSRDLLGLEYAGEIALPADWQGTMHVLRCGASLVKLVRLDEIPNARPTQPERLDAATGLRYWTIPVLNHDEVVAECERAGVPIVKPTVHVRENGARFTLLADPTATSSRSSATPRTRRGSCHQRSTWREAGGHVTVQHTVPDRRFRTLGPSMPSKQRSRMVRAEFGGK